MYLMDSDHKGIYRFDLMHLNRLQGSRQGILEGTLVKDLIAVQYIHAYRVLEQPDRKDIIVLCIKDLNGRNNLIFVQPMDDVAPHQKPTKNNVVYGKIYQSEPTTSNELLCVNSEQIEILSYKSKDKTGTMMML